MTRPGARGAKLRTLESHRGGSGRGATEGAFRGTPQWLLLTLLHLVFLEFGCHPLSSGETDAVVVALYPKEGNAWRNQERDGLKVGDILREGDIMHTDGRTWVRVGFAAQVLVWVGPDNDGSLESLRPEVPPEALLLVVIRSFLTTALGQLGLDLTATPVATDAILTSARG